MCLVDVEKAPKPLPACANAGGRRHENRNPFAKAIAAQKGVMEFLLINHPLDCPICDQGGRVRVAGSCVVTAATCRAIRK